MFRKPMRLEKWIAFDGALGVELVEAAQNDHDSGDDSGSDSLFAEAGWDGGDSRPADDAGADDGQDGGIGFSPFSDIMFFSHTPKNEIEVSAGDGDVEIELPLADLNMDSPGLPFWNSKVKVEFDDVTPYKVFFEIGNTSGGTFGLHTIAQATNDLITRYGLDTGDWMAFINSMDGGESSISFKQVMDGGYFGPTAVTAKGQATADGFRFVINAPSNGGGTEINGDADEQITVLFKSLLFTPGVSGSGNAAPTLNVYYYSGATSWATGQFNDGAAFVDGNKAGGLADVTQQCDEDGNLANPDPSDPDPGPSDPGPSDPGPSDPGPSDPDPDPGPTDPETPEPEPETPVPTDPEPDDPDPSEPDPIEPDPDPVVPFDPVVPPSDNGGSDISMDSSDGAEASAGAEVGADTGADSGGEGGQGNFMTYIYRREDDFEDGETGYVPDELAEDAAAGMVGAMLEDASTESAATAAALELAREVEEMLQAVKSEKYELELAIGRLQEEYLLLPVSEREVLRAALQNTFSIANREMSAVNRVIEQMNRQIAEFRKISPDRRDGVMFENLRDLVDSASRRTGETAALAQAMGAMADTIGEARTGDAHIPAVEELSSSFDDAMAVAMNRWREKAERADPMGKELARYELDNTEPVDKVPDRRP